MIWALLTDPATSGADQSLVLKMKENDKKNLGLFAFHRIWFEYLLELIKPMNLKTNAVNAPIQQDERLPIALRYVASIESETSLG